MRIQCKYQGYVGHFNMRLTYKSLVCTHFTTVRILQANAGVLTNFEVLDFFWLQGATVDRLHFLGGVAPTECKVFDYLIQSAACSQTREAIYGFMKGSEMFELAEAEININNLRPSAKPSNASNC